MFLEEITGSVKLENREIEYKQALDRSNVVDWLKDVAGFANAQRESVCALRRLFLQPVPECGIRELVLP